MEKDDERTSERVYMNMAKYLDWDQEELSVVSKSEDKVLAAD